MTNPLDSIDWDNDQTRVSPATQKKRDVDAAGILKNEWEKWLNVPPETYGRKENLQALQRELKRANVTVDLPKDLVITTTKTPVEASATTPNKPPTSTVQDNPLDQIKFDREISAGEHAGNTLRGWAQGITSGLVKYPQAAAVALGDVANMPAPDIRTMPTARRGSMPRGGYFVGGDEKRSDYKAPSYTEAFGEAKKYIEKQNEQIATEDPYAWYGGNLAGAVHQGIIARPLMALGKGRQGMDLASRTLPTAKEILGLSTATGAIGGYTQREDLTDAGFGAGLGLLFGGASATGAKYLQAAKQKYGEAVADKIDEGWEAYSRQKVAEKLAAKGKNILDYSEAAIKEKAKKIPMMTEEAQQIIQKAVEKQYSMLGSIKSGAGRIGQEISSAVLPGVVGAAGGAAGAYRLGLDPVTGAKYGAGGAIALAKLKALGEVSDVTKMIAGRYADIWPKTAGSLSSTGAASIGAAAATAAPAGTMLVDEIEKRRWNNPLDELNWEEKPKSRLEQLAIDLKNRFGTNK